MPGTVKSGLLPDADRSHKCDRQEEVCRWQNLPLDNDHFLPDADRSHKCDRQEEVCRWQNLPLDNDHFITEAEVRAFRAMRECLSLLVVVDVSSAEWARVAR